MSFLLTPVLCMFNPVAGCIAAFFKENIKILEDNVADVKARDLLIKIHENGFIIGYDTQKIDELKKFGKKE